jgi:hypothetical protein
MQRSASEENWFSEAWIANVRVHAKNLRTWLLALAEDALMHKHLNAALWLRRMIDFVEAVPNIKTPGGWKAFGRPANDIDVQCIHQTPGRVSLSHRVFVW